MYFTFTANSFGAGSVSKPCPGEIDLKTSGSSSKRLINKLINSINKYTNVEFYKKLADLPGFTREIKGS